jgi:hypothetical protein
METNHQIARSKRDTRRLAAVAEALHDEQKARMQANHEAAKDRRANKRAAAALAATASAGCVVAPDRPQGNSSDLRLASKRVDNSGSPIRLPRHAPGQTSEANRVTAIEDDLSQKMAQHALTVGGVDGGSYDDSSSSEDSGGFTFRPQHLRPIGPLERAARDYNDVRQHVDDLVNTVVVRMQAACNMHLLRMEQLQTERREAAGIASCDAGASQMIDDDDGDFDVGADHLFDDIVVTCDDAGTNVDSAGEGNAREAAIQVWVNDGIKMFGWDYDLVASGECHKGFPYFPVHLYNVQV